VAVRSIHHLGVAVSDLDEAVDRYTRLFCGILERRETVAHMGVEAVSMRVGDDLVELLGSLGPETPVGKFLAKRGPGMHHVAFEVDDVGAELARLADDGTDLLDATPRRGAFGLEVAFIHPDETGGVLSELVGRG